MYPTGGAVIRGDLNAVVEEAYGADTFFIGAQVMPPLSMDLKSGTYPKVQIAGGKLLSAGSTIRQSDGSYNEVRRGYTSDTYDCLDRGLEERVPDTDALDLARFFSLESAAARLTMRNVKLDHEVRVAAAINSTANFGSATNSAVAYTVANKATVDFPLDVLAAISRVRDNGAQANTVVLSEAVLFRLASTTYLQNWVRGQLKGNIDTPINAPNIAASFADYGIRNVLIGAARYNSAKEGQAYVAAQVWGTTYVWVGFVNPTAAIAIEGGAGFTFYWNAEGGLFTTETYRDEKRRSNMVRVRQNTSEKVTDATAGTLIATQWA